MAQTGYTPILIYSSSTTTNAPAAGSLTNSTLGSELAINITDGKLFYKDNANAVQVIAWKTTPTTAGGTGLISYTAGDLLYYATGTTLTKLAIGSAYQMLGVNAGGTAPSWQASSTSTLTAQGDLLYASAANTLARLAKNTTASRYLSNSGTSNNPAWAQVDLTNGVTGTLSVGNGGTGNTTGAATAVTSNATTGIMQIIGPGTGTTRVMTIPNANFTAARTDAAQSFTGAQTFNSSITANNTLFGIRTKGVSVTGVTTGSTSDIDLDSGTATVAGFGNIVYYDASDNVSAQLFSYAGRQTGTVNVIQTVTVRNSGLASVTLSFVKDGSDNGYIRVTNNSGVTISYRATVFNSMTGI